MVGIARARGCGTCRKRKIACGLEKPSCAQCVKSKRICVGYRKYPIFIPHQPPKGDNVESTTQTESDSDGWARSGHPQAGYPDLNSAVTTAVSHGTHIGPTKSLVPLGAQVDANPVLRQQLLKVYLDSHLSKTRVGPMQQRIWLIQIPGLPHITPALEISMMALCLAKLGDLHHDEGLRYESLKLYRRALHVLQLALWDPALMLDDQTLTACVALGMYEMSQCPNRSKHGYVSHTLGCRRLVQLRGPEAHADGLGHAVFVHFRIQEILYSLDQGEYSFLRDPLWQEVPWRKMPRTPYDRIYDFLIRAPELRNRGEMLQFLDPHSKLQLATEMIWKCWKMDSELQSVYDSLEACHQGPVCWPELAREKDLHGDSEDGMLFPVAFQFPNLSIANTVIIYWAVQVILWHGMWQLYRLLDELKLHFTAAAKVGDGHAVSTLFDFPPLEHRADFAAPCRNIFQSVEYALQDSLLDQGPKSVACPLRIAYETLRPYPKFKQEIAWAEHAKAMVESRSLRLLTYYIPRR
ncbi:C6 zinc finger domain-containing protein [Cladophialophora carrionii]|uniref:C6 zinc finger domain-containing protein n=1 Tax=Cladophialophora carrionii TaxID=86049 RepID=A0A1C1D176_9EURO|nr:C6 zinc finger domain-containing protein [Cladophialophora carrionii]